MRRPVRTLDEDQRTSWAIQPALEAYWQRNTSQRTTPGGHLQCLW